MVYYGYETGIEGDSPPTAPILVYEVSGVVAVV